MALALELQVLRRAVEESVEHLLDRLRGRLGSLVNGLENGATDDRRTARPREKRIAAALARVRALKLKPRKGRVKDLARVGDLLDKLDVLLHGDS
ncbi:MAG: hypothetical protein ACM3O7_05815 [Acidobacteriota bacterium]